MVDKNKSLPKNNAQMKNLFVPFETAKMLKELGFDETCYAGYDSTGYHYEYPFPANNTEMKSGPTSPMYDQAEEWLWEKHKNQFEVRFLPSLNKYQCEIWRNHMGKVAEPHGLRFDSPITAKRNGIESAIKHLHEQSKAGEK